MTENMKCVPALDSTAIQPSDSKNSSQVTAITQLKSFKSFTRKLFIGFHAIYYSFRIAGLNFTTK